MIRLLQLVIAVAVIALIIRNLPGDREPSEAVASDAPQYVAEGARWQRFDDQGQLLMGATADTLQGFSGGEKRFTTLQIDQLGGEDVWQLQSPSGHQAAEGEPLQLQGPVTGTLQRPNQGEATLDAANVWVDRETQQLYSDDAVTWTDGASEARAKGFDGDWAGRSVKLRGDVNVRFARPQQ